MLERCKRFLSIMFLFSIALIISTVFFSENSYAAETIKPENVGKNLLAGKIFNGCAKPVKELTDGDEKTIFTTGSGCYSITYTFDSPVSISGYLYKQVSGSGIPYLTFKTQDGKNISVQNLGSNKLFYSSVKNVTSIDIRSNYTANIIGLSEFELYEYELIKPKEISDLKETVSYNSVKFDYHLPTDNFSYLKIYRNDQLIADNVKVETFTDSSVKASTDYTYKFVSVSPEGAFSPNLEKKITTLEAPNYNKPSKPPVPVVKEGDASMIVNLPEYDAGVRLKGYNVYLDGKKLNSSVVTGRSFSISDLTNYQVYNVQIQAVSYWDVSSDLSDMAGFKPFKKVIPDIHMSFGLDALVEAIKNWFSSIWLIVAFTICIPLVFIIARNTKHLFLR